VGEGGFIRTIRIPQILKIFRRCSGRSRILVPRSIHGASIQRKQNPPCRTTRYQRQRESTAEKAHDGSHEQA
jgi:hypothetical protein